MKTLPSRSVRSSYRGAVSLFFWLRSHVGMSASLAAGSVRYTLRNS